MEQKLREIFDLDRIREFVEKNIGQTECVDDCGKRRKILVIDTLIDGAHGAYIPGMVLDLFGRADGYDLENPYNWEANGTIHDALLDLECEIIYHLNRLLPSKGWYYTGHHEADGSYCLFYMEDVRRIEVVVIEAGPDYTERLDSWEMDLPDDETQALAEAIEAVKARGYTVLTDDQGGCNEYCAVFGDGNDYIAVTVVPNAE